MRSEKGLNPCRGATWAKSTWSHCQLSHRDNYSAKPIEVGMMNVMEMLKLPENDSNMHSTLAVILVSVRAKYSGTRVYWNSYVRKYFICEIRCRILKNNFWKFSSRDLTVKYETDNFFDETHFTQCRSKVWGCSYFQWSNESSIKF